ncbi:MAG: SHOCT domain-containing protein [Acidimicrobiales bacterium]|nr:SHOCT domain-containing protein [Acidimicrobiales bacterium]
MFAAWQVGQVLWSILWITITFLWIMLVIRVFADIFRSRDMGGVAKVVWLLFIIFLPYLGVFVYLISRGDKMAARDMEVAQANEAAFRAYVRDAAGSGGGGGSGVADELERLAALRASGTIDEAEFQKLKAQIVG